MTVAMAAPSPADPDRCGEAASIASAGETPPVPARRQLALAARPVVERTLPIAEGIEVVSAGS